MNQRTVTIRARHQGFTIVEIMIAMTLSLLLLTGIISVVASSKITYLENERVARNQEGGRAAFEMILRDLRGAGYPGCAQPIPSLFSPNNRLTTPTSLLWHFEVPLQGYEGTSGTWAPALDAALSGATPAPSTGNDVIVIRTIRAGLPQFRTTGFTNPTDDIVVAKSAGQKVVGTTFVINDCGGESFFVATTTAADADTTATLRRSTGGTAPTNQSKDLLASFTQGAQVAPVDTVIYYIAPSGTPAVKGGQAGPALWRIVSSTGVPEEVIPGVERMEIKYGVDTDGDTVVDQYSDANVVDAANNWSNVISARIAILVRSPEPNAPGLDKRTYALFNSSAGPYNDLYERSLFITTVTLRNRTT